MISSYRLYVNLIDRLNDQGAQLPGLTVEVYEAFLNLSILDLAVDSIDGKQGLPPTLIASIRETLQGVRRELTGNDILYGSAANGALRAPDYDDHLINRDEPSDKYAYLVPLPPEVLRVTSRVLDTVKDNKIRPLVDVKQVSLFEYSQHINHPRLRPNKDLAWAIPQRAMTPAGNNTSLSPADFDLPLPNSADITVGGIKGAAVIHNSDGSIQEKEYSDDYKIEQLILGKGYKPYRYVISYYKLPNSIKIDPKVPANCVDSELPETAITHILDYAATKITASKGILPEGYQIQKQEKSE